MIKNRNTLIQKYYSFLEIGIRPVIEIGITPNVVSVLSLITALISAYFYSRGFMLMGGLFLLLTGILDTIDGTVARVSGQHSKFGALFDSTLDRYAEFFIYFGLLVYFRENWVFYIVLPALMGSVMVSYIKARSESLGTSRSVGFMQRPERLILLILGSILNGPAQFLFPAVPDFCLIITLIIIAVFANVTALQRLRQGKRDLE